MNDPTPTGAIHDEAGLRVNGAVSALSGDDEKRSG
jgi:hypothetical protein